jgi:hypothetical protein
VTAFEVFISAVENTRLHLDAAIPIKIEISLCPQFSCHVLSTSITSRWKNMTGRYIKTSGLCLWRFIAES